MATFYRWKDPSEYAAEQQNDPRYDQSDYTIDELDTKKLSREHIALKTPINFGGRRQRITGWIDLSEYHNALTETRQFGTPSGTAYPDYSYPSSSESGESGEKWITGEPWNDPDPSDHGRSWEFIVEDPSVREAREAKREDPDHPDQTALDAFEDTGTSTGTGDAVTHDDRLDGIPVFLDDEELPTGGVSDPSLTGPDRCDQCGGDAPWDEPLERGVTGVREGGAKDGNPEYRHCDPETEDVRSCECCGCPGCAAKSIRHRSTKSPEWACNNPACGIEFHHPVERPESIRDSHDSEKRARLYWECRHCEGATQAPFVGIPEDLLTGEPRGD